jgi:hypothetical protein
MRHAHDALLVSIILGIVLSREARRNAFGAMVADTVKVRAAATVTTPFPVLMMERRRSGD